MKKRSLLFMLFFYVANLFSQNLSPQEILLTSKDTTNGLLVPRRMIVTRDGGFITAGSDRQFGYLIKNSGCGDVIWTRQYLLGDETDLYSVAELPSGEIVAVGACRNCVPADSSLKALILKTNADGILIQDTTFGHAGFNAQAYDVIVTNTGNVAVTGYTGFSGFLGPTDAFLAVLSNTLHTQIWKQLHHFYQDAGKSLIQTSNGGFVIAGNSVPAFLAPQQAQLFCTDVAGTLLWKNTSAHISSQFNDIQQADDGTILALGDRQVDTLTGKDVFLASHDASSGALLQEKLFGSPANDAGISLERITGGYMVGATYGTPSNPNWSVRIWIFRLNEQLELIDEYFRDGYLFAHSIVNAIPLSSDGKSFTYRARQVFFSSAYEIFFKRSQQGKLATLTQAPAHYQLVPRNLATNKGIVTYKGSVASPGIYDEMQLDVLRNDTLQSTLFDPTPQSFQFDPAINAELSEYSFRLYGVKDQIRYSEAEACDVVAGDAFFIQGQSNAEAGLPLFDTEDVIDHAYRHHTSPFIRNFGLKYANDTLMTWRKETGQRIDYADNLIGQWGLVLGKNIVDNYEVPVAILNGGISGIPIDNMMPDPLDHSNPETNYGRFLRRVNQSGLKEHLRAKFMFQGESNAAGGYWDSNQVHYQKFVEMDEAWKQDFPAAQPGYMFQIRPGAYFAGATLLTCLQIEEAQRRLADSLPDWQIMSSTGMNHDGTHYYYNNGYERAGNDMYRLVAHDLYGAMDVSNIYPPTIESLRFSQCEHTEIAMQLRHADDSYSWAPDWEGDFRLEGDASVTITGGQIIGTTVFLTLSEAPGPNFTGLSYTSHIMGSEAPVKNEKGIGMLTFYNLPVVTPDPILVQDTIIEPDNSSANGSISLIAGGGTSPYTYQWSNGASTSVLHSLSAGLYTVTITDADMCAETFVFLVPTTTGTSSGFNEITIGLSPNPCGDYLFIRAARTPGQETYQIQTTDMLGRAFSLPMEPSGDLIRVETSVLPPGSYILTLSEKGEPRWSRLFVKE